MQLSVLFHTFVSSNRNITMKPTEQTIQQVERVLRKVTEKFPKTKEADLLTDIHLRVTQETGELVVYDDDDKEITRCVVEQWIDNKEDDFYKDVATALTNMLKKHKKQLEQMAILRPFSFVLENEDREHLAELFLVDDDTVILDEELMKGMDKDLDDFLAKLLKD